MWLVNSEVLLRDMRFVMKEIKYYSKGPRKFKDIILNEKTAIAAIQNDIMLQSPNGLIDITTEDEVREFYKDVK